MAKAARPYGVKYEQVAILTMRPSNVTGRIAITVMFIFLAACFKKFWIITK